MKNKCGESTKRTSLPDLKIKNFKKTWFIYLKYQDKVLPS
nr:MAG TPA: hypothetical protein [Caudoviricetes sp.]